MTSDLRMWFIRPTDVGYEARQMVADPRGGHQEGDTLTAGTLDELRALLPRGLTWREATRFMGPDVVEAWD